MSEAIKLNDVMKAAPEVTALDTTDRLLAVGSDGTAKRISNRNLVTPNLREEIYIDTNIEWIRIASSVNDTAAVATVYFTNGFWAGSPSGYAVLFATRYANGKWQKPSVRYIGSSTPVQLRTVKIGNAFHLEIRGYSRRLMAYCNGINVIVPGKLESPAIPSDATVYSYTQAELSGGGVKRFMSTTYACGQKGGRHERGDNKAARHHGGSACRLRRQREVRGADRCQRGDGKIFVSQNNEED